MLAASVAAAKAPSSAAALYQGIVRVVGTSSGSGATAAAWAQRHTAPAAARAYASAAAPGSLVVEVGSDADFDKEIKSLGGA
jgi:hypothetical protein